MSVPTANFSCVYKGLLGGTPTTNQPCLLGDRFDVVLLRFGGMRRKRGRFLGRFTWLVGLDLGHLLSNAAFSFQSVIGVLQPQEIAFGQTEKLA